MGGWLADVDWLHLVTIPIFTGVVGWLINWSGLIMLFSPVRFHGVRVPGLAALARVLPRKVQEVPGLLHGGIGWQGIVPARAAKMGSIAVDKAISKLGTPREFYEQLEPDKIAEHIVEVFEPDLPEVVEEIMVREHPRLWRDLPPWGRRALVERVQAQLPAVVRTVTDEIGEHIDQLLDPKLMVIDQFREDPSLVVRIFRDFGERELRMMVSFGFIFGFLLGIPVAVVDQVFHQWWLLPILGVLVGWATNALGMWLIFEPPEPRRYGPFTAHGLFPRRQAEAAEMYADIIASDVITLENIGDFLLHGPNGDRTRHLLATAMLPAIDRAAGPARAAVRVAVGTQRFDNIRESLAQVAVDRTIRPFQDPEFSREQATRIRALVARRTQELPPRDFVEMMRAAIREDEWMLYAHGAIMGFGGGVLHLLIFGAGG
jgi:uncharacterized membrane protein YheB (UPF0754 family)